METSIGEAAVEVLSIEDAEPLTHAGSVTVGIGLDRPEHAALFQQCSYSAGVHNYRLKNVHLDTGAMTLFHRGAKIKESYYLVPQLFYDSAKVLADPLIQLDADVEHIMARAFPNYYHWFVQTVPAIDWSLRNLRGDRFGLLFGGPLSKWQIETLVLLGHENVPRVGLDSVPHYAIPTLNYSEFQNGSTAFAVSRVAHATFKRLAERAVADMPNADLVYVARTDTKSRPMENELELISLLDAEGVFVVAPGTLSLSEQIKLFRSAKAVIGPHGAGLTNIVFCEPETIFYELMSEHYRNPCFNRLAQAAGLDYRVDLFGASSSDTDVDDPHALAWSVDPDLFLRSVRAIKDKVATRHAHPIRVSAMDYLKGMGPAPTGQQDTRASSSIGARGRKRRSWFGRLWGG